MAVFELPVRSDIPAYQFRQELDGSVYTLRFRWSERSCRWIMDIADEQNTDIIVGLPIHTERDVKSRFVGEGVPPGDFISLDLAGNQRSPDRDTFGTDVKLFYQDLEG